MNNNERLEFEQMKLDLSSLRGIIEEQTNKIDDLEGLQNKDNFSNKQYFKKRVEFPSNVYIKDVADISLVTLGDTTAVDQATNITDNFNLIIGALNNK